MSEKLKASWTKAVEGLPLFWKVATFRLVLYCYVVGNNAWMASVEGYQSLSELTPLELSKLHHRVAVAVVTTIIAFLDNGLQTIQKSTPNMTPDEVKTILAQWTPQGTSVTVAASVQTPKTP